MKRSWILNLVIYCSLVAIGPIALGQNATPTALQSQDKGVGSTSTSKIESKAATLNSGDVSLEFSRVYVRVGKVGMGHEHGVIGKLKEGSMSLQTDRGKLVFDMSTFDADSKSARKYVGLEGDTAESTRKQVNANMRSDDVLAVSRFPTAQFDVSKVETQNKTNSKGNNIITITGDFTLHGTKKPVTIVGDVESKDGWYHVRGSFSILQSDFGIKPYSKMLGAVGVADKLEIFGDIWVVP